MNIQFAVRLFLGILLLSVGCSQVAAQVQPQSETIQVLVAYHSLSGNTEIMARSVVAGAQTVPDTRVMLQKVGEVTADLLFGSDAVVVGSPVYWSNMSGEVKTFLIGGNLSLGCFPYSKCEIRWGRLLPQEAKSLVGKR